MVTGTSRCETDSSCAAGVKVALCSINSTFPPPFEGHVLYVNPDLVLADVAWSFLSQFTLPQAPPDLPTRVAGAKLLSLDEPSQGSLGVRFTIGSTTLCAAFGDTVAKDVGGAKGQFNARDAAAPSVCAVPRVACP